MHLVNLNKKHILLTTLFLLGFFVTRLPYLGLDEVNPDGVNWHYRSQQFVVGLKTLDLVRTYQHYHPGVTLMWVMGIPIEILKHLDTQNKVITAGNFLLFHTVAKFSVVFAQLVLTLILIYFLQKLIDVVKTFLVVSLFTFEPFFVGNSRILHMDVLFTLFLFLGLLIAYLYFNNDKTLYGVFGGFLLSMALLTKGVGILGIVYVIGVFFVLAVFGKKLKQQVVPRMLVILVLSFLVSSFVFFPALLQSPVWVIQQIFLETERVGIRNGHGQVLFGVYTRDGGTFYYPLVLLLKTSPVTILGILFMLVLGLKNKQSKWLLFLTLFYVGYFVAMSIPPKKIDRYMIPMFPYLAFVSIYGYYAAFDYFKTYKEAFISVLAACVLLFIVAPLITFYPYYFTYSSPLFGVPETANKIIAQKSFGIGVFALKDLILAKYGKEPNLGFVDTKPMKAIYSNSRVFDIRESGAYKYNILVLGINDEYNDNLGEMNVDLTDPQNAKVAGVTFTKNASLYINGLEFWKIYVKKN